MLISEYMRGHGFPQRPEVRRLSGITALCTYSLTYFYSYQPLMRSFVLEPPIHAPMTDIIFCSRILIASL
jgi:hypothetical protein